MFVQNPVHGAPVAELLLFVQQRSIDLAGTLVLKPFAVQYVTDLLFLFVAQ
jgi:hypothetical protein